MAAESFQLPNRVSSLMDCGHVGLSASGGQQQWVLEYTLRWVAGKNEVGGKERKINYTSTVFISEKWLPARFN